MAGDWLKMRHDLADDPAVIRVAAECELEDDAVLGKLFRLWSWVDRHTEDGNADGVSVAWVDRYARASGFGAALVRAGWLVETGEGLSFPRFDRHCSDTAKARALKMERMRRSRGAARATEAPPEKRREEEPPPPRARAEGEPEDGWERLRAAWNAGDGKSTRRRPWKPATAPDGVQAATGTPDALSAALEAVERLPRCMYFSTPMPLTQFLLPGYIDRIRGGHYDDPKPARRGDGAEAAPVKLDPAFAAAARATEAREAARREAEHRRLDEQARKRERAGGAA